jgi:hypothetical protein
VAPIGSDDQIRENLHLALLCRHPHTDDFVGALKDVGHLGIHLQAERRVPFGLGGDKVQEIPLRHHGNELAAGGQMTKIRH